jgi:glutaconate CoA-transferase subunit A
MTVNNAISLVKDGDVVGIGGFVTSNKPMALIRALIRAGRRGLTIVASPASVDVDLLIANGAVQKLICSYVGAEAVSSILPFHSKLADKEYICEDIDLGSMIYRLKAHILRLPFFPARGPVGTSFPDLNKSLRWVADPFGGPPVIAVPPLKLDVALIHAGQSDKYGNVQHQGVVFVDRLLAQAADRVVVEVERLVANEEIHRNPLATSLPPGLDTTVVVTPYGAHPCACQNYYRMDTIHLEQYVIAAKAQFAGDPTHFLDYCRKYVHDPQSHADYLETVGWDRILRLGLEEG